MLSHYQPSPFVFLYSCLSLTSITLLSWSVPSCLTIQLNTKHHTSFAASPWLPLSLVTLNIPTLQSSPRCLLKKSGLRISYKQIMLVKNTQSGPQPFSSTHVHTPQYFSLSASCFLLKPAGSTWCCGVRTGVHHSFHQGHFRSHQCPTASALGLRLHEPLPQKFTLACWPA